MDSDPKHVALKPQHISQRFSDTVRPHTDQTDMENLAATACSLEWFNISVSLIRLSNPWLGPLSHQESRSGLSKTLALKKVLRF